MSHNKKYIDSVPVTWHSHTKEDGYREILNRYLYSHEGITYKDLIVKCKDKKTNPFSASMARWFISKYSDVADQCDQVRDIVKEIVNKVSVLIWK